jgi:hypothetical protein
MRLDELIIFIIIKRAVRIISQTTSNWDGENVSEYSVLRDCLHKNIQNGMYEATLRKFSKNSNPVSAKMMKKYFDMEFR